MLNKIVYLFFSAILIAGLPACYKPAHTRYESSVISYQFDEPRDYCQRDLSRFGVEMQCDEGRINIQFVTIDSDTPAVNAILQDYIASDRYTFEELDGKRSKVRLATQKDILSDEMTTPAYIAIIPMGTSSLYAVAEGYPTRDLEDEFVTIFKNLVTTFEPYP